MIVDKQIIISYVAGIVTGIISTCLFAFYVGSRDTELDNGID